MLAPFDKLRVSGGRVLTRNLFQPRHADVALATEILAHYDQTLALKVFQHPPDAAG